MRKTIFLLLVVCLPGCGSWTTGRYTISADNVVALRPLSGTTINVGEFTATEEKNSELNCVGRGYIKTQDGETYAKFIEKAFTDELKMAGIYSKSAPVTISGRLDDVNFYYNTSQWELVLTLISSNGKAMTVTEAYDYQSGYIGANVCVQTALAFVPAVQNLIGKAIMSPDFALLLATKK